MKRTATLATFVILMLLTLAAHQYFLAALLGLSGATIGLLHRTDSR